MAPLTPIARELTDRLFVIADPKKDWRRPHGNLTRHEVTLILDHVHGIRNSHRLALSWEAMAFLAGYVANVHHGGVPDGVLLAWQYTLALFNAECWHRRQVIWLLEEAIDCAVELGL